MSQALLTVALKYEEDVVIARQRARQIAALLGFDGQDQTRISTAVSEIGRNAYRYAGGGKVEFELAGSTPPQLLLIRVSDRGPGIADLPLVLSGRYRSTTGMGLGLIGAHRLMDQVEVRCERTPGPETGTEVVHKKYLPARAARVGPRRADEIVAELTRKAPLGALEEVQQQNQELVRTLSELRERQDELSRLNRELEDTNRGVVALYAELDEKADHLRRADEMKSRFLSNMSHEFRTPLNSVRALSQILLDHVDGELNAEQQKQVGFIAKSAADLTALVDDLLDLAKIEAGKIEVRPVEFSVGNLFSALRGMLRPLLVSEEVSLVFTDDCDLTLYTDEGKVSQILRNFISNAIKFTERGEVRVSARADDDGRTVRFAVADTGIGIEPADQARIFDEFTQVANPLQARVKGTGLGLPLCRRLARLLGGEVSVESRTGVGSTFAATIPAHFDVRETSPAGQEVDLVLDPRLAPVLIVEDDPETQFIYEKLLERSRYQTIPAHSLREARDLLRRVRPRAIVLDLLLRGEDSWRWLAEIKGDPATAAIPILVVTTVEDERKARTLGADAYFKKPLSRGALIEQLDAFTLRRVLVIDDDPAARYVLQKLLSDALTSVMEADDCASGLRAARSARPSAIFLDLNLPDGSGEAVLGELRDDPELHGIPIAIVTSRDLTSEERARLRLQAGLVLQKSELNAERAREFVASSAP